MRNALNLPDQDQTAMNQIHVGQLREDAARAALGHVLRQYADTLDPDLPADQRWLRNVRLARVADIAIGLVSASAETDALRQAELAFESTVQDAERDAKVLSSERPDAQRFVDQALAKMTRMLLVTKPMSFLLTIYQDALAKKGGSR